MPEPSSVSRKPSSGENSRLKKNKAYNIIKAEMDEKARRKPKKMVDSSLQEE